MKKLRVVVLTHEDLVPPEDLVGYSTQEIAEWKTELDVIEALRQLGHAVRPLGVSHDLHPIREVVDEWRADVVFNLLMEFQDVGAYQAYVQSYLELLNVHYTGCNPLGILLTRDKALSKKILRFHRIETPAFAVFPRGRRFQAPRLRYPVIVKSQEEEASLGISQASVVADVDALSERVAFMHRHVETDVIAEEYVEGRELTVGILGNERLTTFTPWELMFRKLPEGTLPIATRRVKWDPGYQKRLGITTGPARLSPALAREIQRLGRRVYHVLGLSGYARLDLRLAPDDGLHVIEVNATPDVAEDEDFALAAKQAGLPYPKLLQRILNLGLSYRQHGGV
jgi:D-alanine-D-alanine ligase